MFGLGEPAPTPFDINFSIVGVPVRIHPLFFVLCLLLAGDFNPVWLAIFGAAFFLSFLVHELGHVMAFMHYGIRARVVLYLMGGLAIPDSGMNSGVWSNFGGYTNNRKNTRGWAQIVISAAGPLAEYALAVVVYIGARLANIDITFHTDQGLYFWSVIAPNPALENLARFIDVTLYLCIFWATFNLLPIFPFDGGQIARELFLMADPWKGLANSLWLSCITAAAVGLWAFTQGQLFIAVWLLVTAYGAFQQAQGFGGGRRPW
jgi:stage IV sporulation protein FB